MFQRAKKKEDYLQLMNKVFNHLKDQASQATPHLAAMLTGPSAPSMQAQINQGQLNQGQMTQGQMNQGQMTQGQMNQGQMSQGHIAQGQMTQGQMSQVQMSQGQMSQGQMSQGQMTGGSMQMAAQIGQQSQLVQASQMGSPQLNQIGSMGTSLNQGSSQLGGGQIVGHGAQGMGGMSVLGQQMGMGGVPVSHGQAMNMGGTNQVQPGQMGMGRMGPGNAGIGQMAMVGQNNSSMGMAGGQVISNTNPVMMGGNQNMSRISSGIGMPGQGGDMSWQGSGGGMNMAGMKPNMGLAGKMGPIQMPLGGGQGGAMSVGIGRGGASVAAGTGNMQTRIPSPSYSSSPGVVGGVAVGTPRQNIPISASIASPGMVQNSQQQQQPPPQLMASQHSPAFISPSPSSNMVPSPVGSGSRSSMMGAPSPSSGMVNTPGQPMQQPSPSATNQIEDKAYVEKVKQLQKYVELLKRIIEEGKYDVQKSKKLLDMLQNPNRRMPMETLQLCEKALSRLEIPRDTAQPVHKESAVEVLMEGIRAALKAPNSASVFYKTISPTLEKLNVCSFPIPPPSKRQKTEETKPKVGTGNSSNKISYIIQGEVARLSPRFKVNLDSQQPPNSDNLTLTCHLDDKHLPCVPPLTLTIPEKYPELPPVASLSALEYGGTAFLTTVSGDDPSSR